MIMQLWELDEYGRSILSGYGFAHFPTNPGEFQIAYTNNVLSRSRVLTFHIYFQDIMS